MHVAKICVSEDCGVSTFEKMYVLEYSIHNIWNIHACIFHQLCQRTLGWQSYDIHVYWNISRKSVYEIYIHIYFMMRVKLAEEFGWQDKRVFREHIFQKSPAQTCIF